MDKANTIIAYFSRSGENFKVGNVEKGSAEKIAEIINRLTGIPEYQIVPEKAYPADLSECNKVAREEEDSGLAMMERKLSQVYKTAVIGKGLAIRGSVVQSDEPKAEEVISKYLESIR